jgi:hypothetical protein
MAYRAVFVDSDCDYNGRLDRYAVYVLSAGWLLLVDEERLRDLRVKIDLRGSMLLWRRRILSGGSVILDLGWRRSCQQRNCDEKRERENPHGELLPPNLLQESAKT